MTEVRCSWCTQAVPKSQVRGDVSFCTQRCKGAYNNEKSRETGWLLLTMVRQLWPYRPEGWVFVPAEFPGTTAWRREWNQFGTWARQQIPVVETSDDA